MLFASAWGHHYESWKVDYWGIVSSIYGSAMLALEKIYHHRVGPPRRRLRFLQMAATLYYLYQLWNIRRINDNDTYTHQLVPYALCLWGGPFYLVMANQARGFKYLKLALYNSLFGFFVYTMGTTESIPHNFWHLFAINSHLLFRQL
jgi:hypothetical protein